MTGVIIDKGWKKIKSNMHQLDNHTITVGLHKDKPLVVIVHGVTNEFGTRRIPERSFLRSTFIHTRPQISQLIKQGVYKIVSNKASVITELKKIGKFCKDEVVETIIRFDNPSNAAMTIEKKGFDDPLIETGEMRDSIDYNITHNKPRGII